MKNISISKKTRTMIEEIRNDGESVNDTITRLLENVEASEYSEETRRTTINLSEENLNHLKSVKSYPTETYSAIIERLISEKGNTD